MLKKLIVTGAAAGLLLVSAAAAFAAVPVRPPMPGTVNFANVKTTTVTVANSGLNMAGNHGYVVTGAAEAVGNTTTVANTSHGSNTVNGATVGTLSVTVANSGLNGANGNGTVSTGTAYAGSNTLTVVNTSVSH